MTRTFQAAHRIGGPVLVHVITTKGKGYPYAEADQVGYHAQSAFDLGTGKARPSKTPKPPSYSKVFGQTLVKICEQDSKVVGITAAMATGTGLDLLQKLFQIKCRRRDRRTTRCHPAALPMVLGPSLIYSTFLQGRLINDP